MEKIKVVFGVNDFTAGGMQKQFTEQIAHYDRERFDITLVTLLHLRGYPDLYDALPTDLHVMRFDFKGFFDFRSWWSLFRFLRSHKPDIVVSSLFFSNAVFRILKPFVGYRVISREHNTYTYKSWWHRKIDTALAKLSYTIVAVSTTVADFTAKQEGISRDTFTVIHNGIDVQKVHSTLTVLSEKQVIREELGLAANELVFLNVARFVKQKNHRLLIEGFAQFQAAHPQAKLLLVGDGVERDSIELMVHTCGVTDHVIFCGHQDDVWQFYKVADYFVSTSHIEGFSNAYLEALAAGLPIVATMTAGTDEFLVEGENGAVIESFTPTAVAAALTRVAVADHAVLQAGAQASAERFDIRATVEKYQTLFTSLQR